MKYIKIIFNHLNQPSTYKGLFTILASFGIILKPELADAIIACALGITGLINVLINEQVNQKGGEKAWCFYNW